jgi:hypothetical protein
MEIGEGRACKSAVIVLSTWQLCFKAELTCYTVSSFTKTASYSSEEQGTDFGWSRPQFSSTAVYV